MPSLGGTRVGSLSEAISLHRSGELSESMMQRATNLYEDNVIGYYATSSETTSVSSGVSTTAESTGDSGVWFSSQLLWFGVAVLAGLVFFGGGDDG